MKKLLLFLFSCASIAAYAQQSLDVGLIYGQRLNYRKEAPSKNVGGVSVAYTRPLGVKTHLRAVAGWEGTQPTVQNAGGVYVPLDNYMVIPVRVGIQQYVFKRVGFVFAEPGVVLGFFPYADPGATGTKTAFSYAVGGGYLFPVSARKYVQVSLSCNSNPYGKKFSFSWLALRVAYGLHWGEII